MCRMIMASGEFEVKSVLDAARCMSEGLTASHDCSIRQHRSGWGVIWRNRRTGNLLVHREASPIAEGASHSGLIDVETDFLAVHVRHATLPNTLGLDYTHPISRQGTEVPWMLMHNGYLPTVYRKLGLEQSTFDSSEYFDYIIPKIGSSLDKAEVLFKLEQLDPGGTAGNAILVNSERAYVLQWYPSNVQHPIYYTMHKFESGTAKIISSEPIQAIGAIHAWMPLKRGELVEFKFSS